ncbi:MAG: hypothetical protein IJ097_03905 [Bacilli bacterium]|nr:hypothetical protein [Bacilli bacterium]
MIPNNKIAHRGMFDNKKIPENSIKAFKKALKYNYSIELDVQLTKDNILVVFHDENLKRMTNIDKLLKDTTYTELKKYNLLNTNENIPTLKEVLELVNNKVLLDIEIKDTKRITDTCSILKKELSNYNNYILKSFNPKIVKFLKETNPNIKVGYLITDKHKYLSSKFIIKYSKADFLSINKKLLNNRKINKLKKEYPILVWTIQNVNEINDQNLIYICNNLPY